MSKIQLWHKISKLKEDSKKQQQRESGQLLRLAQNKE